MRSLDCPTNHPVRTARTDGDILVAYAVHQIGVRPDEPTQWADWLHDAADELPLVPAEAWDGIADPDQAMWQADIRLRMTAEAIARDLAAGLPVSRASRHLARIPTGRPRHHSVVVPGELAVSR